MQPSIIVHGGAGELQPDDSPEELVQGCLYAARAGYQVLLGKGTAVDAVVSAASVLEDLPAFNAGLGSALNSDGEVEMDASVMDGSSLDAGAVACVRGVRNPIQLARKVMEESPHILFAAEGALRFAREHGFALVEPASLITPGARAKWERAMREGRFAGGGTIGAVARDHRGHLAAATSTGGRVGKRPGRVGDTPLIGAGTYADDVAGAASATGIGEAIIKVVMTKAAVDRLALGDAPGEAATRAVEALERVQGFGGLVLLDREGRPGFALNTARMARAWIDADGREGSGFLPP